MYNVCTKYIAVYFDVLGIFRIFAANSKVMAKFFLRTQKQEGFATLYITIQKRTPKVSLRFVSTGISVDVQAWNKANKSIQAWNRFIATDEGVELNRKMQIVTQTIDQLFADGRIGGNEDKPVIEDALREISNAQAIQMEQEVKRIKEEEKERRKGSVLDFYKFFMDGMEKGDVRHGDGRRYRESTIFGWKSFGKLLAGYCDEDVTFGDITKQFADGFYNYLESKGFMPLTINNQISHFRKLCNLASEEGVNSNAVSLKVWKKRSVGRDEKRAEIYLNDAELDALYDMELDAQQSRVRDIFFIGYLTGQRFSDYSDYTIDNFKKTDGGVELLCLTQKKTGNYVEIPIWDVRLKDISGKYDYRFPRLTNLQLNKGIRIILRQLSQTVPSLAVKYSTALTLSEKRAERYYSELCAKHERGERWKDLSEKRAYFRLKKDAQGRDGFLFERNTLGQVVKPKWELVSSHTARRSSITNLYKSGILNNREMMSISGHRDERIFEEYIKVGTSEQAQLVGEKLKKAKEVVLKNAQ